MSFLNLRRVALGLGTAGLIACGVTTPTFAQTTLTTELVVNGFNKPVAALSPPGDSRIFVVEQNSGKVKIFDGTQVLAAPFLDIKSKIKSSGNEEGLLGMAFHPDFPNTPYIYVNYTASGPNRTVVERYQLSNPNKINVNTATQIITYNQPFSNHNGGNLRFGADGYLYIGSGDGGSGGDPQCNAQNMGKMLGKMLRIDVDNGLPYTVPATNPFVGTPGVNPEIWAIGLRNPWRYSFDALTGDLYIADVGQSTVEEVDVVPPSNGGLNFGWKIMEGGNCFSTSSCLPGIPLCNGPSLTLPLTSYGHTGPFGGPCSITGGEVYRGCKIPDFFGTYFFADYCSNQIFSFEAVGGTATNLTERTNELKPAGGLSINSITSFGVDGDGEVLIVDQTGEIFRIIAQTQPAIADCDMNGKDDVCEITMNPSLDGNGNGTLDVCEVACGYTTYGVGASPANTIALAGSGTGQIGMNAVFDATGVPAATALFFASLGQDNFPAVGGVGLVSLPLTILSAVVPSTSGASSWSVPVPAMAALVGLGVNVQAIAVDGSQPGGWALSNGVQLIVCP